MYVSVKMGRRVYVWVNEGEEGVRVGEDGEEGVHVGK